VRNAEQLGGYYEMPMAIDVRIVMAVMTVGTLFVRCAGFDMNVWNVVSRVAVPHGGANPRCVSRVEQQ
jgi:hypothetical protein